MLSVEVLELATQKLATTKFLGGAARNSMHGWRLSNIKHIHDHYTISSSVIFFPVHYTLAACIEQ